MTTVPITSPIHLSDGRSVMPTQCVQCMVLTVPKSIPSELVPDGVKRIGAGGRCVACYSRVYRSRWSNLDPTRVREDDDQRTAHNRRGLADYLKARRERIRAWSPGYAALINTINEYIDEELDNLP